MAARVEMGGYLNQGTLYCSRVLFLNPMADINIKVDCFVQDKFDVHVKHMLKEFNINIY